MGPGSSQNRPKSAHGTPQSSQKAPENRKREGDAVRSVRVPYAVIQPLML